jgi:hypothetical protein
MPEAPPYGLEYSPCSSQGGQRIKVLARSANLELAIAELTAYVSQDTAVGGGRSCLVAGARGAGKTTLIDCACEEVRQKNEFPRLIRVRLHGPSLLSPPKPVATKDNPTPPEISVQEHVLKTLVVNLYQTAAEEMSNAFEEYLRDPMPEGGESAAPLGRIRESDSTARLSEFAAQLRLTLDGAPSAATLRYFWNRAQALRRGVLLRGADTEQGVKEIVALASAADAYRSCTGTYTQERKDERSAGDKAESKTELSASGKEVAKAVVGLASGVAAGATAAALNQSKPIMALAGAIAALVSMMTLSYTRTRSRETTLKEAITFLPDTTVSALVHRVLLLLRRFRQAGLVPIFVIDELDKVADPIEPLNDLTKSLKFLFADEGFFCFLTDRTYFAEIDRRNREKSNTPLRTIYNTQMLVRYDTASVREFLKQVIQPFFVTGTSSSITADLQADAEALRYVLTCRSRMLLFELSQDLRSFTGTEKRLNPAFQSPRANLGHQLHLTVQLAIELVLTNEFVANRISRDANFAQTIYDALYHPVNLWYADQQEVDCSPDNLIKKIGDLTGEPLALEIPDQKFLQTQVKALLDLLTNLPELERRLGVAIDANRLIVADKGRLLDSIPTAISLLKRVPNEDNPDIYQWNYNRSGIPFEASAIQDIQNNQGLWAAFATIAALETSLPQILARRPGVGALLSGVPAALSVITSLTNFSVPVGGTL